MAGLALDAPVATDNGAPIVQRIREEFISGTRGGDLEQFRLSYEAAARDDAVLTVRRTQTAPRVAAGSEFVDARTVRLADGALPEPGSIYELRYHATNPRVLGIGFAATRDHRQPSARQCEGRDLLGHQSTHALAFGISQAGRYLRDHLAQGFNRDEDGCARVRRRVHPCRRHRPGVLQHAVRPAGAHAHLARGPRLPRGGVSVLRRGRSDRRAALLRGDAAIRS